ncbi:MAG TPA: chorismate synthase [Bacteroides sp.]|nr:chorismate synthase [Bacteroides sp.]
MNSFGRIFRINIFGESHGPGVGVVIDGCQAGIPLSVSDFEKDLSRRKSGAKGTTPRKEEDLPNLLSGIYNNHSTGAPIGVFFENKNTRSSDYSKLKDIPRPGHADFVASQKFGGFQDYRGGGHFSGRLTLALVAAGVVAKKMLGNVEINAQLIEAGGSSDIEKAVEKALEMDDSIGGLVECCIRNVPVGLGEPFFDSVESALSHIVFAIPATKGIEFGSGFSAAAMRGSEHNDNIIRESGKTETNYAGGINGGISNGNEIIFRVAIKPASSTSRSQTTMNMKSGKMEDLVIEGRHDKCIALRVPPVLEAAAAIVMADLLLLEQKNVKVNHPGR